MDYQFPRIEHLNDVLPAIEGRDEFIVAQREWGTVVNYLVNMSDTFPEVDSPEMALRRECRGLLFYPDGRIMSRRLHKFFNVNERDETAAHKVDLSKPHVILEKLDGSMITPVVTFAGLRWGTKMGITDVSMQAEEFVARNPKYDHFARSFVTQECTPIFEWCSRKQRIVIDYPEDRLVLIAIRMNVSGEYLDYKDMVFVANEFGIDVVRAYAGTTANMEHLIEETRVTEGMEGWIIRFDDGQMLKVKGEWYLRIHKTKDGLSLEKNLIDLLINEKLDDVKPFMLDEDRQRVEIFENTFWTGINETVELYERFFAERVLAGNLDRKRFALELMPQVMKEDPFIKDMVFGQFSGKNVRDMVLDTVRRNVGTQTKVDYVRPLWRGARWSYHFDGDN